MKTITEVYWLYQDGKPVYRNADRHPVDDLYFKLRNNHPASTFQIVKQTITDEVLMDIPPVIKKEEF